MIASMSRRANCYDNAVAESFFSSLKNELIHHNSFRTRGEARTAIFEYIEVFTIANGAIRRWIIAAPSIMNVRHVSTN
jgi:transposase InsO family protein